MPLTVDLTRRPPDSTVDALALALDVLLEAGGQSQSRLNVPISARVQPGFRAFPRQVAVQRSGGTFRPGEISIVPEAPITELLATADTDAVRLSVAREANEYLVSVAPAETCPVSPPSFNVRLTARLPDGRELELPNIAVGLRGAVDWHPRVLQFGTVGIGERAQETLNLSSRSRERFRVVEIEHPDSDVIDIEVSAQDFSTHHHAHVVVEPQALLDLTGRLWVHLELESTAREIIEIPVSAKVVRRHSAAANQQTGPGE